MLLRRYGKRIHSVLPHFDSRALSEISFRRDRVQSFDQEEFEDGYDKVREEIIGGETEGPVQSEAEAELIDQIQSAVDSILEGLGPGELFLVENEQGVDYPKLRDRKDGTIVEGENRLYFHWRVDPPLRLGLYRRRVP